MAESHRGRIDILDYARLLAAFMVMGFHYFFYGIKEKIPGIGFTRGWSNLLQFGYAGVSLFFIISGYVIFYSSQKTVLQRSLLAPVFCACIQLFWSH